MEDLRERWEAICNEYLAKFTDKHGFDIETEMKMDAVWISEDPGTVACIGDMFVDMNDIRYDIDFDVPEDNFTEWYWKSVDRYELGVRYMNYPSFCKGAPDPITPEKEAKIIELRKNLIDAKNALEKEIKDYKINDSLLF